MLTLDDLGENSIANLDWRMFEIVRSFNNLNQRSFKSRALLKNELAWEYCAMTGAFTSEFTSDG